MLERQISLQPRRRVRRDERARENLVRTGRKVGAAIGGAGVLCCRVVNYGDIMQGPARSGDMGRIVSIMLWLAVRWSWKKKRISSTLLRCYLTMLFAAFVL